MGSFLLHCHEWESEKLQFEFFIVSRPTLFCWETNGKLTNGFLLNFCVNPFISRINKEVKYLQFPFSHFRTAEFFFSFSTRLHRIHEIFYATMRTQINFSNKNTTRIVRNAKKKINWINQMNIDGCCKTNKICETMKNSIKFNSSLANANK